MSSFPEGKKTSCLALDSVHDAIKSMSVKAAFKKRGIDDNSAK
jgi:hypothetical protein